MTSSGRSSINKHHDVRIGMVRQDAVGDLLKQDRLAGTRRCDDHTALAEAERSDQIDDAHVDFVAGGLEPDPTLGVQRGQIVEADLLAELVGVFKVDRLDAKQSEVPLVFLGRPDLPRDDGAGFEAEAANLAGRNIDVVGAGEIVVVRASQKTEAVGQNLERAFTVHEAVLLDPLFQDLEDQILFLEPHVLDDAFALGGADELRHGHLLKLGEMDLAALDVFVAIVKGGVAEDVFLFFGKLSRNLDVGGRCGPLGPDGGDVVAIACWKR